MDFIAKNVMLIVAFLLSGGFLLVSFLRKNTGNMLTPAQAVNKINREKAIIVDLREPETFEVGHLVGSRNLPMSKLKTEGVNGLPKNKALPLILVCATGAIGRKAAAYFTKDGYESVFALNGGIGGWIKEDFPIERKGSPADKKDTPTKKKKSSSQKAVVEQEVAPIEQEVVSVEQEVVSVEQEVVSVEQEVTPVEQVVAPAEQENTSEEKEIISTENEKKS